MENKQKNNKIIYAIIFLAILLIIDQVIKVIIIKNDVDIELIPNVLELQTVKNTGGAFGIGQGNTTMFIISTIVVLGLIIRFIHLQREFINSITLYSLFSIIAGGIGNLVDRLVRGYVIDFIGIFPSTNFPKFNFADMYITIGWVILAFVFALYTYKELKNNKKIKE